MRETFFKTVKDVIEVIDVKQVIEVKKMKQVIDNRGDRGVLIVTNY